MTGGPGRQADHRAQRCPQAGPGSLLYALGDDHIQDGLAAPTSKIVPAPRTNSPAPRAYAASKSLAASALVGLPPPTKMERRHGRRGRKHGGFIQSGEGRQQARIAFGLNDAAV